jgi:hypothetical protein
VTRRVGEGADVLSAVLLCDLPRRLPASAGAALTSSFWPLVPGAEVTSGAAHSLQNLAPGRFSASQAGQRRGNGLAHSLQNFAPARLSQPQLGQCMPTPFTGSGAEHLAHSRRWFLARHGSSSSAGGCALTRCKTRRRLTIPARLSCNFSTVARPVGVTPSTNV